MSGRCARTHGADGERRWTMWQHVCGSSIYRVSTQAASKFHAFTRRHTITSTAAASNASQSSASQQRILWCFCQHIRMRFVVLVGNIRRRQFPTCGRAHARALKGGSDANVWIVNCAGDEISCSPHPPPTTTPTFAVASCVYVRVWRRINHI